MNKVKTISDQLPNAFTTLISFIFFRARHLKHNVIVRKALDSNSQRNYPLTSFVMRKKMVKTFGVIKPLISSL